MVLPTHERSDGEVGRWPHVFDARVPAPLRDSEADHWGEDHPPRVAGHSPFVRDECLDGRHLFDVIESTIWREVERPDGTYVEECDFRARLTCVRCGSIREWEGSRTERHIGDVQPVPLACGEFVAQQVGGNRSESARDYSRWNIHRDGVLVGKIDWAMGPRGRAFHAGRLTEWPDGDRVEAASPEGVLRKVARRAASDPATSPAERVGVGS